MAGSPLQDRLHDCTDPAHRGEALAGAVDAVRSGKVVVLPTDTVYGVGADAFDVVAVAMVLAAKHRGREMPPPVLVPDPRTVEGLALDVPMYARILMRQFWPGPLTVVLRAQPSLQWDLGETNGTVALRMPDDEVALALLTEVGPMAVTSANVTGQPAATTGQEALDQLGGAVAVYLDDGPRTGGLPSTILDCTGEEPVVLRVGALSPEEIRGVLGITVLHDHPPVPSEDTPDETAEGGADGTAQGGADGTADDLTDEPVEGATDEVAEAPHKVTEDPGDHADDTTVDDAGLRLVGGLQPSGVVAPRDALRTLVP